MHLSIIFRFKKSKLKVSLTFSSSQLIVSVVQDTCCISSRTQSSACEDKQMATVYSNQNVMIREVWDHNLDSEFLLISEFVDHYTYVAIDTEFPGHVTEVSTFAENFLYKSMKENVNSTKLIQLGFTFCNPDGLLPKCGDTEMYCVWQFNFCDFDPEKDRFNQASIDMLRDSGIDFERNLREGVKPERFGELLMSSKVVLNYEMRWITFQGASDFGYLLKILKGRPLPETRNEFFEWIKTYFNTVYDIKYLIEFLGHRRIGQKHVAAGYGVQRVGTSHLAGSDSLLTSCVFMKVIKRLPNPIETYAGIVCGADDDNIPVNQ